MSTTTQLGDAGDIKTQRRNKSDSSLKSLMAVNNLDSYSLPPSLSVTVARSHKRSFARNEQYSPTGANTLTYVLSPGSDFVYGPDSFLQFTLKCAVSGTVPTQLSFGDNHTALNLFKEVRITHASGIELEQVSGFNLLNFIKLKYDRSLDWRRRYDGPMNPRANYTNDAAFQAALIAGIDISVPLSVISEMFNMEKLLPSYLLAGLRIELLLENADVAFQFTNSDNNARVTYDISQPRMYLDSHTLTDSVQKALARMSAVEGLDVSFASYYDEVHDISSGTRKTLAISKALSRVQDIRAVHRKAPVELTKFKDPRLTPQDWDITKWQASIGSMYFPSHEVDKDTVSYNLAVQGLDQNNHLQYHNWKSGESMLRVQLERSQILTGSGIAISANRGATLIQEFVATPRTINLYVRHTRLVSVFIDNVAVRT